MVCNQCQNSGNIFKQKTLCSVHKASRARLSIMRLTRTVVCSDATRMGLRLVDLVTIY